MANNKSSNKPHSKASEKTPKDISKNEIKLEATTKNDISADSKKKPVHTTHHTTHLDKATEVKSEKNSHLDSSIKSENLKKSNKLKLNKKTLVTILGLGILLVLIMAGLGTYFVTNSAQYTYFQLYQAAKTKDYDKFIENTSTAKIADSIIIDQSFLLEGQNLDLINVKYGLKGNLEFALDKSSASSDLEKIFPTKPQNIFDIFKNSDKIKYEGGNMIISFEKPDTKDSLKGIGGYETGVIKKVKGKYVLAEIKNNPALEEQRQKMQQSKK